MMSSDWLALTILSIQRVQATNPIDQTASDIGQCPPRNLAEHIPYRKCAEKTSRVVMWYVEKDVGEKRNSRRALRTEVWQSMIDRGCATRPGTGHIEEVGPDMCCRICKNAPRCQSQELLPFHKIRIPVQSLLARSTTALLHLLLQLTLWQSLPFSDAQRDEEVCTMCLELLLTQVRTGPYRSVPQSSGYAKRQAMQNSQLRPVPIIFVTEKNSG